MNVFDQRFSAGDPIPDYQMLPKEEITCKALALGNASQSHAGPDTLPTVH